MDTSWRIRLNVASRHAQLVLLSLQHAIVLQGALETLKLMATMEFATINVLIPIICMLITPLIFVSHPALLHPAISQTLFQATALVGVLMAISHRLVAEPAPHTVLLVSQII